MVHSPDYWQEASIHHVAFSLGPLECVNLPEHLAAPRLSDPRESEEESLVPVMTNLGSYILAFPLCLLEASH